LGETMFETQEVREKDSKGRHTTTHRQLISLKSGALIIDTPGMREVGNIAVDSGLDLVFDEIKDLASRCRYHDCSHAQETGCAVQEAIKNGIISDERFQNYLKIKKESQFNELSYLDKRRKDKAFGKMIKSHLKHKAKNRP
ncbi:MAG: GTPase RsgA, partial [Proteobacteria bacterium]|nr:GTPase RsgA [Pseudomonadota bacterium]